MDLIVGAGVTGLSYASFCGHTDYLILDRDREAGGYCKTIKTDGYVWDYSGHFFHFRNRDIQEYLLSQMERQQIVTVARRTQIRYKKDLVDYPFQKNIHQLNREEFIECLYDLYFSKGAEYGTFREMLYARFGTGISEKFLIPYNTKVYACDLNSLDRDAMGRFFPHASLGDIVRNFRYPDNSSYNSVFMYPRGGAIEYINALRARVSPQRLALNESLLALDIERRRATTCKRIIQYDRLVSSMPFDELLRAAGIDYDTGIYRSNKVLVFNLGFDGKGDPRNHWVYFPEERYCFYRVGFYDNFFNTDRMSLYVELGFGKDAPIDMRFWERRVMADLRHAGIVTTQKLVSKHSVIMDPAYVHVNCAVRRDVERQKLHLSRHGVYSIGRYGSWTYCSIEDNILEARQLAGTLNSARSSARDGRIQ